MTCKFRLRTLLLYLNKPMLSLERTKELLNDPTPSDKEIEEIRDGFHSLTEIIFEKWKEDREKERESKLNKPKPKD